MAFSFHQICMGHRSPARSLGLTEVYSKYEKNYVEKTKSRARGIMETKHSRCSPWDAVLSIAWDPSKTGVVDK